MLQAGDGRCSRRWEATLPRRTRPSGGAATRSRRPSPRASGSARRCWVISPRWGVRLKLCPRRGRQHPRGRAQLVQHEIEFLSAPLRAGRGRARPGQVGGARGRLRTWPGGDLRPLGQQRGAGAGCTPQPAGARRRQRDRWRGWHQRHRPPAGRRLPFGGQRPDCVRQHRPTSYLRFADGEESPAGICWGETDRTGLVRVPGVDRTCCPAWSPTPTPTAPSRSLSRPCTPRPSSSARRRFGRRPPAPRWYGGRRPTRAERPRSLEIAGGSAPPTTTTSSSCRPRAPSRPTRSERTGPFEAKRHLPR